MLVQCFKKEENMGQVKISLQVLVFVWCVLAASKGLEARHDYADALNKAILFFDGQRSGKLPADHRINWRADSALSDGKPDKVNLVGGYYDAGDNVKFLWPMSFTITLLSWAETEYRKDISLVNQTGYLRSAIKWGTDLILKAHISSTTLYTQIGDGDADHKCWERPEDMDTPRTLYKISSASPGTEAAADAAAALAAAAIVFQRVDSAYYSKLLNHSKSLFEFADKYRGSYQASCPFYCSYSGYQDELLWAASWLYRASGDKKYLSYVTDNQDWSHPVNEFSWDNKLAGAQALLANEFYAGNKDLNKFNEHLESFVCALMPGSSSVQIKTTPGGLLYTRDSSNLQYVTAASAVLFAYSKTLTKAGAGSVQCGSTRFSASQIRAFAKSQVDYILGENPKQMSYMVGYGKKYPTELHHRGSSIPSVQSHPAKIGCNDGNSYYNMNNPNPNIHTGAIVGGPDSNDGFSDSRSDYSHAEPTTYLNAAFVASVSALLK